jgi:sec-independent protein translocase protein TatB
VFNISATELLVIAVVALLVLGPEKLPEAMRKLGRATKELRRITSGFEAELRDALSEPEAPPAQPPAPTPTPTPTPAPAQPADGDASASMTPANPTAVPEPAPTTPDVPGEQASSGETAA